MELWLSAALLIAAVSGFIVAAKLLKKKPTLRRFIMLACVILGAMMLLYTCLSAMLLGFASPDPTDAQASAPTATQTDPLQDAVYLSLDDLVCKDGIYYLTATTMTKDLAVIKSQTFVLNESLTASMLPGWDVRGKRYDFFTAKDFLQYWEYSREQGFPVTGSVCRFQHSGDKITVLNELDPTGEKLFQ